MLLANAPLKIVSFIIGYTFWYIFGHTHTITTRVRVPVSFYGAPHAMVINSPESITLELSGKRSTLRALDKHTLALHIDAQKLHHGPNTISISSRNLFLPDNIKLLNYSPSNMVIQVSYNNVTAQEAGNTIT